jgi:type IV pilus assembly protein PilA
VLTLKGLARRRGDDEEGFTLIELMVVVLIIAILIAIAIPTFLGARSRAQDRAAQSDLRNALTTEKTIYTDKQQYSNDMTVGGVLNTAESSLNWNDKKANGRPLKASTLTNVLASPNDTVCLSEASASGKYFAIGDIATTGGSPAGTYYAPSGTTDPCAGATVATIAGWPSQF